MKMTKEKPKLVIDTRNGFTMYRTDFKPLKKEYLKLLKLFSKLFAVLPSEEDLFWRIKNRLDELLPKSDANETK